MLNLKNNSLVGTLPSALGTYPKLAAVDPSVNKLDGSIARSFFTSMTLMNLNPTGNHLTKPIPLQGSHTSELLVLPSYPLIGGGNHKSKSNTRVAIIVTSVVAAVIIAFILLAYYRVQLQDFHARSEFSAQTAGRNVKVDRSNRLSLSEFHRNAEPPPTSLSFFNDHLLTSNSRSLSGKKEFVTENVEQALPAGMAATSASTSPNLLATSGSPVASSPRFVETIEQPVTLVVYSPDRLVGELYFLDNSLAFTAEELSRAPAEVLGRSSHGTLYKATLSCGHMLTVKWLRVGLVKHKKDFTKEVKRIGSIRHPNVVPVLAYYWGPREQERLVLADNVDGDSVALALHLYESTRQRYSVLQSLNQRFKVVVDFARSLVYLHEKGMPHGNLKPTNVVLSGPNYDARLTDY